MALPVWAENTLRVATFNTELARKGPGLLLRDILRGTDKDLRAALDLLARTKADVVALQGFDYDHEGRALNAFADALAALGAPYPYRYAAPPNAGRMTTLDLDMNGKQGEARDAQGYGRFFGQGAMALLSQHPIARAEVQDFTPFLWRDLPDNMYPSAGDVPWNGPEAKAQQRLPAHGAWIVPIDHPELGRLHVLTFHASPPVFDGPEDRNGRRNHDEIVFWTHYLDGTFGPAPEAAFILMGDANLDPKHGDGRSEAIRRLLADTRLQDPLPGTPTVAWEKVGKLRVDYVLPSADWRVLDAQVVSGASLSPHSLVWVDLAR